MDIKGAAVGAGRIIGTIFHPFIAIVPALLGSGSSSTTAGTGAAPGITTGITVAAAIVHTAVGAIAAETGAPAITGGGALPAIFHSTGGSGAWQ
ncbi:hypothetical protein HY086_02130 [Candidatus Gottesmanbacteria bacterium]|nr:hypothetical protein [Candidatus Gottesmanbacteria bacterium]